MKAWSLDGLILFPTTFRHIFETYFQLFDFERNLFFEVFLKTCFIFEVFFKKTCFDVPGYFPDSALLVSFLFWKIDFVTIRARIKNLIGLTQTLKVL